MRNCKKNERPMKYALYDSKIPILDADGFDTFEFKTGYRNPVDFKATLSAGKSDAESTDFGNDVSYDRIIGTHDMTLPVDENSLIWVKSEPVFLEDGSVDPDSADYRVAAKPIDGLNSLRIAIKSITKSHVETSPSDTETTENEENTSSDDGF